jgi:hypothetical protein
MLAMNIALKETYAIWWGVHKETIQDWYQCKLLLHIRFGTKQGRNDKYDGRRRPVEHIDKCRTQWRMTSPNKWPPHVIHTLEGIPWN